MKSFKLALFSYHLFAAISLILCQRVNQQLRSNSLEHDPKFDARVSDVLARNVLQFAQEIGTSILQDSDKASEVFSPLSIFTALSMLLLGSNGQTYQELMSLLKLNNGL